MLTPPIINIVTFFYPIGNTPAICLTQSLPAEEDARMLLLGCGDVRNILFTAYCEVETTPRRLDITCCDIERAIIARNILLLTLTLDQIDTSNDRAIWDICYHWYLDDEALGILQKQAKKLHALSASMENWHASEYGKRFRFCDQSTLTQVRQVWDSYCTADMTAHAKMLHKKRFEAGIKKAKDRKSKSAAADSVVFTGVRSAAPVSLQAAEDLPRLFEHYWNHGTTEEVQGKGSRVKNPNPMFTPMDTDIFALHYGTDPLLGFHLATAYVPLTSASPLNQKIPGTPKEHKTVAAARLQFGAWMAAFRRLTKDGLTIRFCAAEALAFAHTLQHRQVTEGNISANWYRAPYKLQPLLLDGEDYNPTGNAPLRFNVIDTSNLVDHLGALNVLVATAPLLDHSSLSASLYTESLVRRAGTEQALMDNFLCGHLPTISMLLGLFPLEYWTNATATSTVDEGLWRANTRSLQNAGGWGGQMHNRVTWKRSIPTLGEPPETIARPLMRFGDSHLAHILFSLHLKMFAHEDVLQLFSKKLSLQELQMNSNPHYHRGSLVALLRFVKDRTIVNWDNVMTTLLDLIESNRRIGAGINYMQELYLQLHLQGVFSAPTFKKSFYLHPYTGVLEGIRCWKDVPPVVCITLKVPRAKLRVFTDVPLTRIGTPMVNCSLASSGKYTGGAWHNAFSTVQLGFGKITTFGSRESDDFAVSIVEDEKGWAGSSPLLVAFCVPTWVVLLELKDALVAFGIQSTPQSTGTFVEKLGLKMNVYETRLGDEHNVYITKQRPNQSGHAIICDSAEASTKDLTNTSESTAVRAAITANVDRRTAKIVGLTGRINFLSADLKSSLSGQTPVQTTQTCVYIITVTLGKNPASRHDIHFPVPVIGSRSITRIARTSSYIEVEVPIAEHLDNVGTLAHFMYPLFLLAGSPVVWNMPRLNLNSLPILDLKRTVDLQWLTTHTSLMWSTRERRIRNRSGLSAAAAHYKDARINFKESLFSLFMYATGLQGKQARVFGLHNQTAGGTTHVLILVSEVRLDMANHTVVLDSAILPLTNSLAPKIGIFLKAISQYGVCNVKVDDEELRLWRETVPAMVERCREWSHGPTCEYKATGARIPLSVEHGKRFMCSCGDGRLPREFISGVPGWDIASKYAVRAAISPSFAVESVEQCFEVDGGGAGGTRREGCGNCGVEEASGGGKLLHCARCQVARYCSSTCQRADWKKHKVVCGK